MERTNDEWTVAYDDRFATRWERNSNSDTIRLCRPHPSGDESRYEVIGRIGDDVFHTRHDREVRAEKRAAVLQELAEYDVEFDEGDRVYVIDYGFDPIVQRGYVSDTFDEYESIEVVFPTDPYDRTAEEPRTVSCEPSGMIHVDADIVELYRFIGRDDLLEVEDFARSGTR